VATVLVVDDEANLRRMIGAVLAAEGHVVREAPSGEGAVADAAATPPDAVLLDLTMPGGMDGLATLERLRAAHPDLPVVMMSGRAGLADAVRATRLGAVNFLEKPLTPEGVLLAVNAALELARARREAAALRADLGLADPLIGGSAPMAAVRALIARVAPTDARVLVLGESGTGKELVAAAVHAASGRARAPYVRVNCAAIPRDLVESEMFGHEAGAFTGAMARRLGRFELAHGGTLLLDEVGDLGLEAQAKLLRAIETQEIERVGGSGPIRCDVRVLAATHRDLTAAVRAGTFREDLLFRLDVLRIVLPPLRERTADLPALVAHFTARFRARAGVDAVTWTPEALAALAAHPWPGNVRELANTVERLAILHAGATLRAAHVRAVLGGGTALPPPDGAAWDGLSLSGAIDAFERALITRALAAADGNVAEAARRLQTDRPNLYRRLRRLGLHAG
jgi:two-component system nitrogen regulation response regulator NtrX